MCSFLNILKINFDDTKNFEFFALIKSTQFEINVSAISFEITFVRGCESSSVSLKFHKGPEEL